MRNKVVAFKTFATAPSDQIVLQTFPGVVVKGKTTTTSTRRVPAGATDYWEFFKDTNILRRVHKRPRVFLFTPTSDVMPVGFQIGMLGPSRTTTINISDQPSHVECDQWSSDSQREKSSLPQMKDFTGHWTGFTEFTVNVPTALNEGQNSAPKRRIRGKTSPEQIKNRSEKSGSSAD